MTKKLDLADWVVLESREAEWGLWAEDGPRVQRERSRKETGRFLVASAWGREVVLGQGDRI